MLNKVTHTPVKTGTSRDVRVSVRVPTKLKSRVRKIAKGLGVDESDVVRMALNAGLPNYEERIAA